MSKPSTDDLVRRYRAGETLAAIAAATGLPRSTVHDRLRRARPSRPSPGPPDGLSEDSRRLLGLAGPMPEIQRAALEAAARLAARGAAAAPRAVADELGAFGPGAGYQRVHRAIRVLRSLGRWPSNETAEAP
jgi:IclR helix-turn-helix domain